MKKRVPKVIVRSVPAEEYLSPQAFYAALTLVLAVLCFLAAGLGVLGLIEYPLVPKISSHFPLFCTTFGGSLATIFATSSFIFSKRADNQLKTKQLLNISLRKSCEIKEGEYSLIVLTKTFQKRVDLLPTLSKKQKLECLQPGQWALHKEGENLKIIAKFDYENDLKVRHFCGVSLKLVPMGKSKQIRNVIFDPASERLYLYHPHDDKMVPFKGDLAINFLMQKMWIFCKQNLKTLINQ
jgi:hypothetical protein